MRKASLVFVVCLALVAVVAAAGAKFFDTETSSGDQATAGVLDLKVKGSGWNDDPEVKTLSFENMIPGECRTEIFQLKNTGTTDGVFSLKVMNPCSLEVTLEEPEKTDGDTWSEIDPSGYDANDGSGELWDQCCMAFFIDDAYGQSNGQKDWNDTSIWSDMGTPGLDYSATYCIPLDTDLTNGGIVIPAGEKLMLGVQVKFVDDSTNWWWGGMNGVTNNMAMSDKMTFDMEFGLYQP